MSTVKLSSKPTRVDCHRAEGANSSEFPGNPARVPASKVESYPQLNEALIAGAGDCVCRRYDDVPKGIDEGGSIQIRDVKRVHYVGRFGYEFEALMLTEGKQAGVA